MNKRIFPFEYKKYRNYSNYLNWLNGDINSLQYYLDYFNPDFHILNEKLYAIQSNDWEPTTIEPSNTNLEITFDDIKKLKYREGIYFQETTTINNWTFQPSQIIFAKEWTRKSNKVNDLNHYLIISQPPAGIFLPQSISNGLSYSFYQNGQFIVGTSIPFALELSPSRYYIVNSENEKWSTGVQWRLNNVSWTEENFTPLIQSDTGVVWMNSYPIMHEVLINNGDQYEEFIFDNDFDVAHTTMDGRSVIRYVINAKNISQNETKEWGKFLIVSII